MYKVVFSRQAYKDLQKLKQAGLGRQAKEIVGLLSENPYKFPPYFEKLIGNLQGYYSRRLNIQHRCVYRIIPNADEKDEGGNLYLGIIHILRMWTHYE